MKTPRDELQSLLQDMQLKSFIPPLEELALKASLRMSWASLRELKLEEYIFEYFNKVSMQRGKTLNLLN